MIEEVKIYRKDIEHFHSELVDAIVHGYFCGKDYLAVEVEYEKSKEYPATWEQPAEGGYEIYGVAPEKAEHLLSIGVITYEMLIDKLEKMRQDSWCPPDSEGV